MAQSKHNPFEHRHGRTIYNTSSHWAEPFGDMLDTTQGNPTLMELHMILNDMLDTTQGDPMLMEFYKIVKEESIRAVKEWQTLVRTNPFGTSGGTPDLPPSWLMAGYILYQNETGSYHMEDPVDEAELEKMFYKYFNFEDYMA
jgi:hypothetical protein